MKKIIYSTSIACFALLFAVVACKKETTNAKKRTDLSKAVSICDATMAKNDNKDKDKGGSTPTITLNNPLPYTVSLVSRQSIGNGQYEWIWSVTNPNPGNGSNGTAQDLSHWGITLGTCATIENVVKAEYSGDGKNWTPFTPEYKQDKSQDCYSSPLLKFDFGTDGAKTSYYRLVLNVNVPSAKVTGLFKSGTSTGCGTFEICGIGNCPQ
jgi:hypothetical protein